MATATLDELIEQTRFKANVTRSNFATNPEIIVYLNEALDEFRELVVAADDSYYQGTLDFNIGAQPDNETDLPEDFWKVRGLDAFAGDRLRQTEVYAREFRNRFDPGIGYGFGGDGNSLVVMGWGAEQANPFRLTYTPRPEPLAALVPGVVRSIEHNAADGTNVAAEFSFVNGSFSTADVGGTLVVSGSGVALDGTYTVLAIVSATNIQVLPAPTPSLLAGVGTVATLTAADDAARTFAVVPTDNQQSGYYALQNGAFGPSDVGSFLTLAVDADAYDGTVEIIQVVSATVVRVTPAIAGPSGSLTGTATVSRQPAGTRHVLDLTENGFSEYFSVRAAMAIARKKRQDTLVGQLGIDREKIEGRIAQMSKMRQAEPQQAPNLWHRRRHQAADDLDV